MLLNIYLATDLPCYCIVDSLDTSLWKKNSSYRMQLLVNAHEDSQIDAGADIKKTLFFSTSFVARSQIPFSPQNSSLECIPRMWFEVACQVPVYVETR